MKKQILAIFSLSLLLLISSGDAGNHFRAQKDIDLAKGSPFPLDKDASPSSRALIKANPASWYTFGGTPTVDESFSIDVDSKGNIFVAGYSDALWGKAKSKPGGNDACVAKLDPKGNLLWNIFLGSKTDDLALSLEVEEVGTDTFIYVVGKSDADWGGPGPKRINQHSGYDYDGFLIKIKDGPTPSREWNTFFGSNDEDNAMFVTADGSQNVYVAGYSNYEWKGKKLIHKHSSGGNEDCFVVKFDHNGDQVWNTFWGAKNTDERATCLALDTKKNIYAAGTSEGTWGKPKIKHAGGKDAFLGKLTTDGKKKWHTFMGCSQEDIAFSIAVDETGKRTFVYVTGWSKDTWSKPIKKHAGGGMDAFLAKIQGTGVFKNLTFIGSPNIDYGRAVTLDASGDIYVAGFRDKGSSVYSGFLVKVEKKTGNQKVETLPAPIFSLFVDKTIIYITGTGGPPWPAKWGKPLNPPKGSMEAYVAKIIIIP